MKDKFILSAIFFINTTDYERNSCRVKTGTVQCACAGSKQHLNINHRYFHIVCIHLSILIK